MPKLRLTVSTMEDVLQLEIEGAGIHASLTLAAPDEVARVCTMLEDGRGSILLDRGDPVEIPPEDLE